MGPGFGDGIARSMLAGLIVLLAATIGITIAVWELGKWVFRHLSIGWN